MFRIRRTNGDWVTTPVDWEGVGLSENKLEARIFPDEFLEYWKDNKFFEIVPLAEDELMSLARQPRLEGF